MFSLVFRKFLGMRNIVLYSVHVIPVIITCTLQGMFCDMGIPRTFYGGKICSVCLKMYLFWLILPNWDKNVILYVIVKKTILIFIALKSPCIKQTLNKRWLLNTWMYIREKFLRKMLPQLLLVICSIATAVPVIIWLWYIIDI